MKQLPYTIARLKLQKPVLLGSFGSFGDAKREAYAASMRSHDNANHRTIGIYKLVGTIEAPLEEDIDIHFHPFEGGDDG